MISLTTLTIEMKNMWKRVDVYDEFFHMLMLTLSDKHGHNFGMYVPKEFIRLEYFSMFRQ